MILKDLSSYLDSEVPLSFQENYDNSGLQIGLPGNEITSALITLDITEEVTDEAIEKGCDVIVSHHPLIFNGLKHITGNSITERIVYKAIKNNLAIYSSHTNLDMIAGGVSRKMAEKMNLQKVRILSPKANNLLKLVTYIPESHIEEIRNEIFRAGAGVLGNYDRCSFASAGTGSYRGNENTNPFAGEKGEMHFEKEIRFETVMLSHLKDKVISALLKVHPYEEVAYDIFPLANRNDYAGLGCVGELPEGMEELDFLKYVSEVFNANGLRYTRTNGRKIKQVALCGGSGISLLQDAFTGNADVFITADIKYHNFFEADNKILLVDIGHYESEKFSTEILYDLIIKKFPKFALRFSEVKTNPINYF